MKTHRIAALMIVLFAVSGVSGRDLAAADGVGCKNCTDVSAGGGGISGSSSGSGHSFAGPDCTGSSDPACRDCHAFNACHTNPQFNGTCYTNHWACGATQAGRDAFENADPASSETVLLALSEAPLEIRWLSSGYLVRVDCRGTVVEAKLVGPVDPQTGGAVTVQDAETNVPLTVS